MDIPRTVDAVSRDRWPDDTDPEELPDLIGLGLAVHLLEIDQFRAATPLNRAARPGPSREEAWVDSHPRRRTTRVRTSEIRS